MGVDYVVTFSDATGVNIEIIQEELVGALNTTNNDTFPGDLQISSDLTFQGDNMTYNELKILNVGRNFNFMFN